MATGAIYQVTASALNLRDKPSADGMKVGVIPNNGLVTELAGVAAPGWLYVSWNGLSGYVASSYLQQQSSGAGGDPTIPAPTVAAQPAPSLLFGPAPPNSHLDQDTSKLHPIVRDAIASTLAALQSEGLPFRIFEAFRTPERQMALYAQGRTTPGGIVTKARAWQSYHQYGLAADLVLFRDNAWSWSTAGQDADAWTRMHQVAGQNNLRPLNFELPHVEYNGPDWSTLEQGQDFPAGGDDTWMDAVSEAAARWTAGGGSPAAPPIEPAQRPPLPAAAAGTDGNPTAAPPKVNR